MLSKCTSFLKPNSKITKICSYSTSASNLKGKTILITGASSGIGQASAYRFAELGTKTARLQETKNTILKQYPSARIETVTLDVRLNDGVQKMMSQVPPEFRNIDVLVNNAGLVIGMDEVDRVDPKNMDTMIDTNIKGLIYATQAVLPSMKKQKQGHIINISSVAGTQSYPGGSIYCGTKHFVDAFTKSLRMELVGTNLRVTSISPGMVETEFSLVRFGDKEKAKKVYEGLTPLSANDIADLVVFAASRPEHVQIADILVYPTHQASATCVAREATGAK